MKKALFSAIIFIILVIFSVIGFKCKGQAYFKVDFEGKIFPVPPDTICKQRGHIDPFGLRLVDKVYFKDSQLSTHFEDKADRTLLIRHNHFKRRFKCLRCGQKIKLPVNDTIIIWIDEYYFKDKPGSIIIE